ncbi:MAG: hypothetical protein P4L84_27575 [Isosphaeraceae bacterium]|nr:hypothetical protein [Isosphaeraceae bacterium]
MATFSGLTLDRSGSGYTLQVSSNGLTQVTTGAIAVTPGAPSVVTGGAAALPAVVRPPTASSARAFAARRVPLRPTQPAADPLTKARKPHSSFVP